MNKVKDGYKITELGEIPEKWEVKEIKQLYAVLTGATPLRKKHDEYFLNGIIPWVKTMDLNDRNVYFTDEKITDLAIRETSCKLQVVNTVLIAMYGGFNQIGRTGILKIKGATNQAICSLPPIKDMCSEYLNYYLIANRAKWKEVAASSRKDPNITKSDVENFKIVVPALSEQYKIADILLAVDEKVENTDNLIEKTKELKKGLMQRLLTKGIGHDKFKETEIGRIPEEWEVVTIGEICEIGRGRVISKKEIENSKGIYPVYSSQTTNNGCMGYTSTYDFDGEYITWTTDGVNAGTTFYREGKFNCTNVCGTLKLKEEKIKPKFLSLVLNNFTDKYVVRNGNPKLMNNIMAIIKVPISKSIEEQNKISNLIFSMNEQIDQYEVKKVRLQELKKGLMQKLLTGKIRVQ